MRKILPLLLLALSLSGIARAQNVSPSEMARLRSEYIKTTETYRASLQKLLALYEASEQKAEARLAQSKDLYRDGLISIGQVRDSERVLEVEKEKVRGVQDQIASADKQIAEVPTVEELAAEYKRALAEEAQQRKRVISHGKRPPPACHSWMVDAERRESLGGQTLNYKVVCGSHH